MKAEQIALLEDLGFESAHVYIHTGNWVFESNKTAVALRELLTSAIFKKMGWEVPVLVLNASKFQTVFNNCSFVAEKKEKSYFTLLAQMPTNERIAILKESSFPGEEWELIDQCVYFYASISAARVKMNTNFIEKKLQVSATARNYKTMVKLLSLSQQ